jgi:hypothetical protein
MIALVLMIGLITGVVKLFSQARKDEKLILEKGISEDLWTMFIYSLWLFALPPVAASFFPGSYSVLGAIFFTCCYLPTIILSRRISPSVSKGYDFERKVGRNIDKITWLGYAGIGLVILNWGMINAMQFFNNAPR